MRYWPCIVLSLTLAAQTHTGEVTVRDETPTFQSTVNLVRVPVVVRDKSGKPVGGLHKEDFRLTDKGKPQDIAQFSLESSAGAKSASGEQGLGSDTPDAHATSLPTRYVVFVIDDVHLSVDQIGNIRTAMMKTLDRGIPSQQRVGLLTLSGTISQELTNDVGKIRETMAKIQPVAARSHFPPATFYAASLFVRSPGEEAPTCTPNPNGCSLSCTPALTDVVQMQTMITADCLQMCGYSILEAPPIARATLRSVYNEGLEQATNAFHVLNNTVRLLGSMPGDRVMVLVSPGMYLPDELQRSLYESIDRATRSGVIINTLDARGVYTVDPDVGISGCALSQPATQQQLSRLYHEAQSQEGLLLDNLAASTGGTAVNDNDFASGLNRLSNPPDYVYYLGFYPRDLKPDGKFHDLKVTLANGQAFSVQARKGYWAPDHIEDAATVIKREIQEAVFSNDTMNDLPLDLDTQFYKTAPADAKLEITAHLDIRQLHLRKTEDSNRNDVTVVCALFDGSGNYLQGVQKVVELRIKDASIEHRRKLGLTLQNTFDVKRGVYMVRVVARDTEGRQMAAAGDTVEIP
ncbi:MAG TPA: VWA domain-containing protein [Bryobacteraceae bacterium]|nr:VWA domain-containing protein [Bryobacteraceae bacterium]